MRDDREVVADHHVGQTALFAQCFEQVQHFGLHAGVERRGGLVEQQHLWLEDQRTRDRDALALAARQLVRVAKTKAATQAHFVERAFDARFGVIDAMDRERLGEQTVNRLTRVQ